MKKLRRVFVIMLLLAVALWLAGAVFFWGRFRFRTEAEGISAFYKTPGELALELMERTERETFTFILKDGSSEVVTFADLGVYRPGEMAVAGEDVNPFLWPLSLFSDTEIDVPDGLAYVSDTLIAAVRNLNFVVNGTEPSVDASVTRNADGSYSVSGEVYGNQVDTDRLADAVVEALADGARSVDVEAVGAYREPSVLSDDAGLIEYAGKANSYRETVINVDLGAGESFTFPVSFLDDAGHFENGELVLDEDIIRSAVDMVGDAYDTKGIKRTFVTAAGMEIRILPDDDTVCGFEGWELDRDAFADMITDALLSGNNVEITAPWIRRGAAHGELNDFGDTYIEVSISLQKMWMFVDGECVVETDVVTGLASDPDRRTPSGVWWTTDLYREHTMTGDYGSAFCHYFIRVTLNGVGIHDASWRSSFGGSIYLTDGSHGCINAPYEAVNKIVSELGAYGDRVPIIIWE